MPNSDSQLVLTGVVDKLFNIIFLMCKLGVIFTYRIVKIKGKYAKCLINVNFFFSPLSSKSNNNIRYFLRCVNSEREVVQGNQDRHMRVSER